MESLLNTLHEFTLLSLTCRLLFSILCGAIVGYERGKRGHPAGIKTHSIVCLGACLVMCTGQFITLKLGSGDPARLAAQVISGIGFLGAGTILVTPRNKVRGLTTASGLWCAACIGIALGIGFYEGVIIALVCFLIVTFVFSYWDRNIMKNHQQLSLYIEYRFHGLHQTLLQIVKKYSGSVQNFETGTKRDEETSYCYAFIEIHVKNEENAARVLEEIRKIEGIYFAEEM